MTRIVSGKWRGRKLAVPEGRLVRPTAERVREAWLSVIGPDIAGASILDLFAGTGALGLEALSRGALHATFVEQHPRSLEILRSNIEALGAGDQCTVLRADALQYASGLRKGAFDVALADPPFASDHSVELVALWRATPFAQLLAVEHDPRTQVTGDDTRRWGDIAVTFLRAP